LAADDYAEYQDEDFLELLGISLDRLPLHEFWPRRGPVWDGLAGTSTGKVLLVEAKANLPELASPPSQASPDSARMIRRALDRSKDSFGAPGEIDWSSVYYQYANRLAHLHLLRAENAIDAHLVFVYFINADDVNGPSTVVEWEQAISDAQRALGIGGETLSDFTHDVFIDAHDLAEA
jgi:hypothetical protein